MFLVLVGCCCFWILFMSINIGLTAMLVSRGMAINAVLPSMLVAFFVSAVLTYFIMRLVILKTRGKALALLASLERDRAPRNRTVNTPQAASFDATP
jgi:hypothetical protein